MNKARKPRAFNVSGESSVENKATKKVAKPARKPRAIKSSNVDIQYDTSLDKQLQSSVEELTPLPPQPSSNGISWLGLALSAFSALFLFAIGLYFEALLRDLFARNELLGIAASVIAAIGVLALLVLALRELLAIFRLRKISNLQRDGQIAKEKDDLHLAKKVTQDISAILAKDPSTAQGRTLVDEHLANVLDGPDLIHLVERDLLAPLDKEARKMIMASAKRVSIVTAISPRALVDVGFVLYENTKLIRTLASHYGGRPGKLGMWRLTKRVVTHLAATGAIAVGDGIVQQLLGHGLAAKLSARLGEGVINGLLTARVGIAAIDICRPLAFDVEKRPGVNDFLSELAKVGADKEKTSKNGLK